MSASGWIPGALLLGSPGRGGPEAAAFSGRPRTCGTVCFRQWELLRRFGPGQRDVEASGEAVAAAWVTRDEGQDLGDRCVDGVVGTDARERTGRPPRPPLILARPGCFRLSGGNGCLGCCRDTTSAINR